MSAAEEGALKAVHIVSNMDVGGGQEVVRTLASYLPSAGCTPLVIALRDGPMRAEIERAGARVFVLAGRRRSILALPFAIPELIRIRRDVLDIIRREGPAIVQTHLLRSMDFLMLTLQRDPAVLGLYWTVHNARLDLRPDQLAGQRWLVAPKRIVHRLLYRLGARRVDGLVAVSEDVGVSVREQYRPPPGRLHVIPNGVDVERFRGSRDRREVRRSLQLSATARVLIVVAKLHVQKGHLDLLDSLEAVLPSHPKLEVLIVGDGPERARLVDRAAKMTDGQRIHFLGNRADIPRLLSASDLFVLPSLWEGLPVALLEAMAAGVPVVATSVSGSRDVVTNRETGLLVPPGNPDQLAKAILSLLDDPAGAKSLGVAGRKHVSGSFSAQAQAERHVAMYRARLLQSPDD